MNKLKIIISLFVFAFFTGCTIDEESTNLDSISAPKNISAMMKIKQDNSGEVTIIPTGDGVTQYEIYFGDGTVEPGVVNPGNTIEHTYTEGTYQVKVIGTTLDGQKSEVTQSLTVSFIAPENLEIEVNPVAGDNLSITVEASADYETFFQVYFGEDPNQIPVDFMQDEVITYTYATPGTYTLRVVALSGGVATAEDTEVVIISNPVLLPIDFESATLNYAFFRFWWG